MFIRHVLLAALAVIGCTPARPLESLRPVYPDAIRTANAQGEVAARLNVARTGRVVSVEMKSGNASPGLFESSIRSTLGKIRFAPARRFGISRSSQLEYLFQFVLYRPDRPLLPDEKWI